ncbi:MAG: bifunctional ornithine acetyltransferase/N-acetylglutamate synthase [Ruminococcaceae bacterium]|nr:bifunctional ornithine acetyltransferase/N-acetylglutamate synthase [Oscillospiraceae bacterium]
MKKGILIAIICVVIVAAFVFSIYRGELSRYKERYFSNEDAYNEVADMLTSYYNRNGIEGEVSIWISDESGVEIFYDESEPDIASPLTEEEIDVILDLLSGTTHEYVSIDENFIELGNSTGYMFIYFSRSGEKPEKISRHHNMLNFGGGWYFSISRAR